MTETTTFIHKAIGQLRSRDNGHFTAEFEVEGAYKMFSGIFAGDIHPPLNAPHVTLDFEHPDHLYGKFRIDTNSLHIVGPKDIHLPFIKPGIHPTPRFLIDGPLTQILKGGILVKGVDWLIWE